MKIAAKNFLGAVKEDLNKYTVKDKRYKINASPITTSKFGPSGSLNNKKSNLEHERDIIPRISNEVFFDVKYVLTILLVLRLA